MSVTLSCASYFFLIQNPCTDRAQLHSVQVCTRTCMNLRQQLTNLLTTAKILMADNVAYFTVSYSVLSVPCRKFYRWQKHATFCGYGWICTLPQVCQDLLCSFDKIICHCMKAVITSTELHSSDNVITIYRVRLKNDPTPKM